MSTAGNTEPRVYNASDVDIPSGAVYIGRRSKFGNPFYSGTRDENCDRFEKEVLPNLDVSELRGKNLICHCKPLRCHGDSILKKANKMSKELIFDYETMGQNTMECVVLDCAFFTFDRSRFKSDNPYTFEEIVDEAQYLKLDVKDQVKRHGFVVEGSAVEWWGRQGDAARKRIAPKPDDITLQQYYDSFMDYIEQTGPLDYFWSRSNTFDPIIIWRISRTLGKEASQRHDKLLPFWAVRDTRTFIDALTGFQDRHTNSFIPEEDKDAWHKKFEQHNCVHDIAADLLRMQVLERLYDE